jgi:hypothetical protein
LRPLVCSIGRGVKQPVLEPCPLSTQGKTLG